MRTMMNLFEGGVVFSRTWRQILHKQYGIYVGAYSYGKCLKPGFLPRGTRIGNYCSIASNFVVHRRNHPVNRLSTHPFFYNRKLGLVDQDSIEEDMDNALIVGHDVWIGTGATILPRCKRIGNGAVIGAGSVVTKDVEAFTIVAGNPARVIKERFPKDIADKVAESEWWKYSLAELVDILPSFMNPASLEAVEALLDFTRRNKPRDPSQ
jgi:acetyltransferase-like isoleucine patch superfamily enzyme